MAIGDPAVSNSERGAVVARPLSVRHWLALLLAICVVPVWIGALAVLERAADTKREMVEAQLLHSARLLSLTLDDRLASVQTALLALETSPALDHGDLRAFHRQARQLAESFPGSIVILSTADAQLLVHSRLEFGAALPRRAVTLPIQTLFETARPILLPHFRGVLTGRSQIGIDIPVMRDGKVLYDLGMTLPCERITEILLKADLPTDWIAAYIDNSGTIIGRNLDADKFVGKLAKTPIAPGEKITEAPTIDGIATDVAVVGSTATGWGVAVGVPKAVLEAEVASWRRWMLAAITGLTLVSTAIAWSIGRRIALAIEALVTPAIRIGQGEEVSLPPSAMLETEAVGEALASACRMLKSHRLELRDRERREHLIREQAEELGRSNADLEQFATVASHDLQTPLRNIVRYSQLLARRYQGRLDRDADEFIGFIVDSGKQMTRLISDLLAYSRVGSQAKALRPISASEAISQAMINLDPALTASGTDIAVGPMPVVLAEHSLLVSLFQNLLGNAIKYRAPDRDARVAVTAERIAPDRWRFKVEDNGIGIEPQYLDKIFEIFQRLNPAGETEGTGIGLTLCRRIVQRFGGTIWADSTPGRGTAMLFTLRDGGEATPDPVDLATS